MRKPILTLDFKLNIILGESDDALALDSGSLSQKVPIT